MDSKASRLISFSSELDLIITPLLFVTEPDAFIGFTSIASDGEVPLKVGSFTRNTPSILVTFFSHVIIYSTKIVVIAAGPKDAYSLFDDKERPDVLFKAAKEAKPVRLVCLDVALSSLPDEDALFALGVDRPLYFSVHSAYAKLAPNGGALIHIAKYLGTSIEPKPREDQPELEEFLDLLQPGWRQVLVKKRPLPNMVVSNALVTAADGGLGGRPDTKRICT